MSFLVNIYFGEDGVEINEYVIFLFFLVLILVVLNNKEIEYFN